MCYVRSCTLVLHVYDFIRTIEKIYTCRCFHGNHAYIVKYTYHIMYGEGVCMHDMYLRQAK